MMNHRWDVIGIEVETMKPTLIAAFEKWEGAKKFTERLSEELDGFYTDVKIFGQSAYLGGKEAGEQAFYDTYNEIFFSDGGEDYDDWYYGPDMYPCGCCTCCGCDCDDDAVEDVENGMDEHYSDMTFYCPGCGWPTRECECDEEETP